MVCPPDLLQQELDCLRRTYTPFAEFAALPTTLAGSFSSTSLAPAAPAAAAASSSVAVPLPRRRKAAASPRLEQDCRQERLQQFLCAVRHPLGSLVLTIGLELDGLRLLHVACLPHQTPQAALKAQDQRQQHAPKQHQQLLLREAWGIRDPAPLPDTLFESFEGLLQAVCPTEFQRMQQALLLQRLKLQPRRAGVGGTPETTP
ncbi:uncharacterized protein LOC34624549 [Cyclospora cayetanensis]|uniref:Uncharacterized protein n=2 Tax=Cyclospora cayetanensis TaxID=88456 RepID=A0A1D3DAH2_9EIME|nr:uncharacterized protein LOC34624549 [Cyclospora cayetanensis]OEH80433.1 hypothetical protein cyc_09016 [Cyclospora cayetanensis]